MIANSINNLVHVVPYPLESGILRPQINDILSHRGPHIRNIDAGINPSGCGVRSYARVLKVKSIGAFRITEIKSADVPNSLTWRGTEIVSMYN